MFDNLSQRLSRVVKTLRGEARLTEENIQEALREVRLALLEADVALPVVRTFIERVRAKALGAEVIGSLTPGQAAVGVVYRELVQLMGETNATLNLATQPPAVVLLAGLQGSGKTTTAGKLALWLKDESRAATSTVPPRSSSSRPWRGRSRRISFPQAPARSRSTSRRARSRTRAHIMPMC